MSPLSNKLFLLIMVIMLKCNLVAQSQVTGTVKDANTQEALIGASISVKGTVNGTVAGEDGQFNLKTEQAPPFILVISYIGYRTQEISIQKTI
ncbi:MAG: carboxypeptidase-like regulatory domain-containing protein [Saprospiraceae bacterium]|nr:carboxypeptidase-like regulatory domain-containing protein [Saprospiraceae bacterium]